MERETVAADSSVHGTLERPPVGSGSAVPLGYGYPPEYAGAMGYGMPRSGTQLGLYGPAAPAADGVKVLDPASLIMALRRRWFLALSLGLLTGAIAAAAVWNLWPPITGGAQIQLMVNAVSPYLFIQEPSGDFNVFKRTQAMIVKSRRILDLATKEKGVADLRYIQKMGDPVRNLEQSIGAEFTGPELMTLSLPAYPEDEADARVVLDAVVNVYLRERRQNSPHSKRLKVLETMYQPYAEAIKEKRKVLEAITKALNVRDAALIEHKKNFQLKDLDRLETRFLMLKDTRMENEFQLKHVRESLKFLESVPVTEQELDAVVAQDEVFRKLDEKVKKDEADLEKFAHKVSKGTAYTKILNDLNKLKIKREALRNELRKTAEEKIRLSKTGELTKKAFELEAAVQYAKSFESLLDLDVQKLRKAAHLTNESTHEAEVIKAQLEADSLVAAKFLHEMDQLKLELQAPERVTKFSETYIYQPTMSRKQLMATWGAGVGSFGLVLFGIAWWEFRGRRISSVDEVVNTLGLRVVGSLPALPDRRGGRHMPSNDSFYPNYLIESVDTTRTMLLHAARRESLRSVMVTSANSGEGKTSLSIQLAASLARAGRKTLLIDGDMRNPAVHQVFNLQREPGFSELVRGEVEVPATVAPTSVRNLWLIPGGRWSPHTTEVLSQEAVVPILERLKGEFDFIIVDSSPVLAAVDSLLIGQQVDAVIFSILHEVSHSPSVFAAQQRLESLGVRILGAVVNGVQSSQLGHKTEYVYEDESPPPDDDDDENLEEES